MKARIESGSDFSLYRTNEYTKYVRAKITFDPQSGGKRAIGEISKYTQGGRHLFMFIYGLTPEITCSDPSRIWRFQSTPQTGEADSQVCTAITNARKAAAIKTIHRRFRNLLAVKNDLIRPPYFFCYLFSILARISKIASKVSYW
jgi:hypothetical protein